MNNEYLEIFLYMSIVAFIIIIYSWIRCNNKNLKDPLSLHLFEVKNTPLSGVLDGWSISHFILYFLFGLYYPTKINFIIGMGILWELFEYFTSNSNIEILSSIRGISRCKIKSNENVNGDWFYAKLSDVFVNAFGAFLGFYLSSSSITKYMKNDLDITFLKIGMSMFTLFILGIHKYNF